MTRTTYTTPDGRATRDAIIETAMALFAVRGYRGTSIDAIAAEVGVSRQGVLHHFPAKVAILIAVLERRDELDGARATEAMEKHGSSVLPTLQALLRRTPEDHALGRSHDPLGREHRSRAPGARLLRRALSPRPRPDGRVDGARAGRRPRAGRHRPRALASLLMAVLDGLQLQQHLDEGAVDYDASLRALFRLM